MRKKNCHQFTYFYGKKPFLHQQRDSASFIELIPLLSRKGYEFDDAHLNFPSKDGMAPPSPDMPLPGKGELLVMTTRPTLNNDHEDDFLIIQGSDSPLENRIITAVRPHFSACSRREVILSPRYMNAFKKNYEDRCSTTYTAKGKKTKYLNIARYQATVNKNKSIRKWTHQDGIRTGAYLLYIREAWESGPDVLVCFSMTGSIGLIWAYLVRTKFPYLLDKPVIAMSELIIGDIPDRPTDLSFTLDWDVQILLDKKL